MELISVGSHMDSCARVWNLQETLFYSSHPSFYLQRKIQQVWKDGIWKTAELDQDDDAPRQRRILTVYRFLLMDEVLEWFAAQFLPGQGGVGSRFLQILGSVSKDSEIRNSAR
jgi:hypothetical protein